MRSTDHQGRPIVTAQLLARAELARSELQATIAMSRRAQQESVRLRESLGDGAASTYGARRMGTR